MKPLKPLFAIVAFLTLLPASPHASELAPKKIRDFTAVGVLHPEKPELWAAGVERDIARTQVRPFIERIRGGKRLHQKLPTQLESREVHALFSASFEKKAGLATISQWVVEQGDKPQLHFIPAGSKTAFKLAEAPCVDVESVRFEGGAMLVQCSAEDGVKTAPAPKSVALPSELKVEGVGPEAIALPMKKLQHATFGSAVLPGAPGEENRLELTAPSQKMRIIRPLTR